MEPPALTDETLFPDDTVLSRVLGDAWPSYREFLGAAGAAGVTLEWRYYRDGKSWLGKAQHRKKTMFWLSAAPGRFRTTFYFTAAAGPALADLAIGGDLKAAFAASPAVGKLRPLTVEADGPGRLADLTALVDFKKSLK